MIEYCIRISEYDPKWRHYVIQFRKILNNLSILLLLIYLPIIAILILLLSTCK